ncbi:ankyrin repeat-containing domain protein [Aspergillus tamarii]|uniref:Ankyrin repeat-containing domain protein n=1 Tax=Aspergillus tamarii TaxID=41984 RepID=A0A5N6UA67_ASPTM|nr:ankyrin repeat-containing domain protein [Aspergillus tamarii]
MGESFQREFERIKSLRYIQKTQLVVDFLNWAQVELGKYQDSNRTDKTPNFRGPYERTLLSYAAMADCTELTNYLLRRGALKDDCDQDGRTSLSWAAEYGALATAKILVNHKADVNAKCDNGSTPLTWLRFAGSNDEATRDTEAYLIQMGAIGETLVKLH